MVHHRPPPDRAGQHGQGVDWAAPVPPGLLKGCGRINLQLNQPTDPLKGVGENSLHSLLSAVEVDQHRCAAASGVCKQHRRTARTEQPPLNFGDFQVRVDRVINRHQQAFLPERFDALPHCSKSHTCLLRYGSHRRQGCRVKSRDVTGVGLNSCRWNEQKQPAGWQISLPLRGRRTSSGQPRWLLACGRGDWPTMSASGRSSARESCCGG